MKLTACNKCRHMIHHVVNQASPTSWYNYLCEATPRPPEFDPIAGEMVAVEPAWENCRSVNRGDCPKFEPKE